MTEQTITQVLQGCCQVTTHISEHPNMLYVGMEVEGMPFCNVQLRRNRHGIIALLVTKLDQPILKQWEDSTLLWESKGWAIR